MLDSANKEMIADNQNEAEISDIMDPTKLNDNTSSNLTDWAKEPSISELKEDLDYARQENTDQLGNVDGWLAIRNTTGSESGVKNNSTNRSQVQPKLVRKHNEWRYPALSEPFLNTERMFNIKPRTHEDVFSSKQNELIINWQFDTKLTKVDFIDRYVRTTVDEGTCIVRVGWKREVEKVLTEKPIYSYYPIDEQDEEQLQMLMQATELMVNNDPQFEQLPDDLKASVEYSADNQRPVRAEQTGTRKEYEKKVTANCPELTIVEVGNFFIDPSCKGVWREAQFMVYTFESTRSTLSKRKLYKNLDKVNWGANAVKATIGEQDHLIPESPTDDSRSNSDKSKTLVYEYHGLYDVHDDGIMTPIIVTFIGDTIIQMIENPFPDRLPPFVIVPYMPILGSSFGESDASLLQDNQRVLGAVSRGMIDLLGRSANAQTGYAKGFLDPINKKRFNTGEDFEFNPNSDPKAAIRQMEYPEIPNSALQMSAQQNAEAESLSGVKGFSGGITGDSYGKVARGINGAMDAQGQREMSILRRLAEGMRLIGQKIISMNQLYLSEEEVVRVTNKEFVKVKRSDLAGNFDLLVDISTQSADEAKSQDLGMMLQTMGPDMDPGLSKTILSEIADLKRMPHLAQQIREYEPQPDPIQQEIAKLDIEKLKGEIALNQAKYDKLMAEAENIELDTQLDASGVNHERAIEHSGAQARGNRDLEVTKALLAGETPAGNIEAGVGFNKLTQDSDQRDTKAFTPPQEPIAEEPLVDNSQLGLPQEVDPLAIPQ